MAGERPEVYSIAAHRGFADALVAGLAPRFADPAFGLARTTLILPSSRASRTVSEAFIRHYGEQGSKGMLMPRMAVVGDLDLDETLGPLLDTLGAALDVPPAVDPQYRWLRLAELIRKHRGDNPLGDAALLRFAFSMGQVMARLLAEEIRPEQMVEPEVLALLPEVSSHWQQSLKLFIAVQDDWLEELRQSGEVDAATRRNQLFRKAAERLRANPPSSPIVAAGVTSAAPALADLLRAIADLPNGAVVLPDCDLSMDAQVWDELGSAGSASAETPFERDDAVTHPQYHLKLLLNRMGVARGEVEHWQRAGLGKGPPARSHAISSLFLPPEASKSWGELDIDKRRLAGVRMVECAHPEEEAQAIALMVRQALVKPGKRVAVITPDRGLAGRVLQHLRRWHIEADDTAGQPLAQTAAGRALLLLADVMAHHATPVPLMALLGHPLVRRGDAREGWLKSVRLLERKLRGPRPLPGLDGPRAIAVKAGLGDWWEEVEAILAPLLASNESAPLADLLDLLVTAGEALCAEELWSREDGRALSRFVEELRLNARATGLSVSPEHLPAILRDAMDRVAVRPPYGGHPRIGIYGLLEGRMTRADLVICAGLNEGTWPATPSTDPLLAPAILRALGVPGADFRIGLSAHDLAGAMGAPEVVLTRARRDAGGPVIASRFWLRVQALLGSDLLDKYMDRGLVKLARNIDMAPRVDPHPRPDPRPSPQQRRENLSVTALDRLRSDPYQFYAQKILSLKELDALDAEPTPAWQGTLAHKILESWHEGQGSLADLAEHHLKEMHTHPLMRALWRPRLMKALEWIEGQVKADPARVAVKWEEKGQITYRGVTINGTADRIDKLPDGSLAIVDYKTGKPPSSAEVEAGFAMQLGTLGLMALDGAFGDFAGEPTRFEYWSLGKSDKSETGFGYKTTPIKEGSKKTGMEAELFLPEAKRYLDDALDRWILGDEGFTARLNPAAKVYAEYDQLMRLDEWMGREEDGA